MFPPVVIASSIASSAECQSKAHHRIPGLHEAHFPQLVAPVLGNVTLPEHLGLSEPRDRVVVVQQVGAFAPRVDHFVQKRNAQNMRSGASQLALADSGFASDQQRPVGSQCRTDRPEIVFLETMARRGPGFDAWQIEHFVVGDFVESIEESG
jgi:hypothetical protein